MRFLVFNVAVLALLACAWLMGLFRPFFTLGLQEWSMLGVLGVYAALGAVLLVRGRPDAASHVANSLPIFGLFFTGLGLLLSASHFTNTSPAALALIFRGLIGAIAPNIIAVGLMLWLREMGRWLYGADL